ncbi:MAG: cell division protein ZapA [Candidatus Accumulibacter sp.]|jgi:cell division protein ZapA|nr:cell division protein ZapA [Accumulibacter sp.]
MPSEANFLDIVLLGREYRVACSPEDKEALSRAAAYVDGKMREIAGKTRSNAAERIAVMAALNIAHELLSVESAPPGDGLAAEGHVETGVDFGAVRRRIFLMEAQLDALLEPQDKLI